MKVDSSMKAPSPSSASGDPNTSPTYEENADQFIPNWNSCTSPVAAPIAKLIKNNVPKKCVSRSHRSSRVRYHRVCITASSGARPSVSGTKMKWYSVVVANCQRESSSASVSSIGPGPYRGPGKAASSDLDDDPAARV